MKYDTTITHSMKPVEDMPKKTPFLQILCSRLEFLPNVKKVLPVRKSNSPHSKIGM